MKSEIFVANWRNEQGVEKAEEELALQVGGWFRYYGMGAWLDGELVIERATCYTIIHDEEALIAVQEFADAVREALEEECVLVMTSEVKVDFRE